MELNGKSFVGSRRIVGDGPEFNAVDPATGAAIDPVYRSVGKDQIDEAMRRAREAAPEFARSSGRERATLLRTIAQRIESRLPALIERMPRETGLPGARVEGESGRTCAQLRMFADLVDEGSWVDARIEQADPERTPVARPDLRSMLRPIGPVVVFGASNFPLAFSTAGGDTASALAAGCPVIVKAHPAHPGTSEIVAGAITDALRDLSMNPGVFSLLYDAGHDAGTWLVQHPDARAVGFTGSRRGGRALMDLAATRPRPIPVYAEMGSVNPVFFLGSALRSGTGDRTRELAASITLAAGQFCTNPGLIVLPEGAPAERFVGELAETLSSTPSATMLTREICSAFASASSQLASRDGVETVLDPDTGPPTRCTPGLFRTTAARLLADRSMMEEVFGPASLVVTTGDRDELLELAGTLDGQLTASIHADPQDPDITDLLERLENRAGRILFGGVPTGVEVNAAMIHGGPYPATSDGRSTSVGTAAILRFARPVSFQNCPDPLLPDSLKRANPLGIWRQVDGVRTREGTR